MKRFSVDESLKQSKINFDDEIWGNHGIFAQYITNWDEKHQYMIFADHDKYPKLKIFRTIVIEGLNKTIKEINRLEEIVVRLKYNIND